ncbi:hypothetical protein [Niabella aurantiaca]|uniref:hypothetical protein n=1 Tax=Niabella aurantiaca TaxID=379900 RepID=UPI00037424F7|nr:hypothetical protein [Niabella aurantiaca]
MKRILLSVFVCSLLVTTGCHTPTSRSEAGTGGEGIPVPEGTLIPFTRAANYFVRNDYTDGQLENNRITTQQDFDAIFGAAATMGSNGKPTPINFGVQDAVAVILPVSDSAVTLEDPVLQQEGAYITLSYNERRGPEQTFTTRPFLLLVVSKKYKGIINTVIKK